MEQRETWDLYEEGFLERSELVERIVARRGSSGSYIPNRLARVFRHMTPIFMMHGLIVRPANRKRNCLYAPELVTAICNYLRDHPEGTYTTYDLVEYFARQSNRTSGSSAGFMHARPGMLKPPKKAA